MVCHLYETSVLSVIMIIQEMLRNASTPWHEFTILIYIYFNTRLLFWYCMKILDFITYNFDLLYLIYYLITIFYFINASFIINILFIKYSLHYITFVLLLLAFFNAFCGCDSVDPIFKHSYHNSQYQHMCKYNSVHQNIYLIPD